MTAIAKVNRINAPTRNSATLLSAAAAAALVAARLRAGTVVVDASFGHSQSLAGPNFSLPATLGSTKGGNLFHSLATLDLSSGESLTFTGASTIHNVLTRITGGSPASINGTLRCTIPKAAFYLISPAGVIFGPDAALDVGGSFTVTTASNLNFSDKAVFATPGSSDATLTSATPASFGFAAAHPAAITLNGAKLRVGTRQSMTIVSGPLSLSQGALLRAPVGTVRIASVAAAGQVAIDPAGPSITGGDVSLAGNSAISTTGVGGGRTTVAAHDLSLTDSGIDASSRAQIEGRGIDLNLTGTMTNSGGYIQSNNDGAGAGGAIVIRAAAIHADRGDTGAPTGFEANVGGLATGNGADVTLHTSQFTLSGTQSVDLNTKGAGHAGNLTVIADALRIDGTGTNVRRTAGLFARTSGVGNAGDTRIHAGQITIINAGEIDADTEGLGNGGAISITTGAFQLVGNGSTFFTGVSSSTTPGSVGIGGSISIHAANTAMQSGAQITSQANAKGHGGAIALRSDALSIDGRGSPLVTGVFADAAAGSGAAGSVAVTANSASIIAGGRIGSRAFADGAAGTVRVSANQLKIDGRGSNFQTGLATDAISGSGSAGDIFVTARAMRVLNGAKISSDTSTVGAAGRVAIHAGHLVLRGYNTRDQSTIVSEALPGSRGDSGSVQIDSDHLQIRADGVIDTSTQGAGRAGQVAVRAASLLIDGGGIGDFTGISSDTQEGSTGVGGAIAIAAKNISLVAGGEIDSNTDAPGRAGSITVNGNNLLIDGRGTGVFTGLSSTADEDIGAANDINVHVNNASLLAGGKITTETDTAGAGGNVTLVANQLKISGRNDVEGTGLIADTRGSGNAGSIRVHASGINLLDSGLMASRTFDDGNAGAISITADAMNLHGQFNDTPTSVTAAALGAGTGGKAGSISIHSGVLNLIKGGTIDNNTEGVGDAGGINLTARHIVIDGNDPNASTYVASDAADGSGNAGTIRIAADTLDVLHSGGISSDTSTVGHAGDVIIHAGALRVGQTDSADDISYISSDADPNSLGHGGNVSIHAGRADVFEQGDITSTAEGAGVGGNIDLHAGKLSLRSGGLVATDAFAGGRAGNVLVHATRLSLDGRDSDFVTGVSATSHNDATGDGGSIDVKARSASIVAGARFDSDTFGAGRGGNIALDIDDFKIDGRAGHALTGVSASSEDTSIANAGQVSIRSDDLSIRNGGQVLSAAFSVGNAGAVSVDSGALTIDGGAGRGFTGVSTSTDNRNGNAGAIRVAAANLKLLRGGDISSDTSTAGSAGDVTVSANQLLIDPRGLTTFTGVSSEATIGSAGAAGNVYVSADSAMIRGGGNITSSTSGSGDGGNIVVNSHALTLDGAGQGSNKTGVLARSNGLGAGNAGQLTVVAGELRILHGGQISTSADDAGGGDEHVTANTIELRDGQISATAARAGGNLFLNAADRFALYPQGKIAASSGGANPGDNGGNITIGRTNLVFLPGVTTNAIAANANQGNGGNITLAPGLLLEPPGTPADAINASSLGGLAGTITIQQPNLDLTGELAPLIVSLGPPGIRLAPTCSMMTGANMSSFTLEGGNGLGSDPGNLLMQNP